MSELVVTFTFSGTAFGIEKDDKGKCELVRQGRDGKYTAADGTSLKNLYAYAFALRKWPEYLA